MKYESQSIAKWYWLAAMALFVLATQRIVPSGRTRRTV